LDINDYNFSVRNTRVVGINENPERKSNWKVFTASLNQEMINSICDRSEFIGEVLGKEKMEIGSFHGSA